MTQLPKPEIALFLPALNDGGAERVFVNLAGALARKNHAVDLLVVKKEGPYLAQVSPQVRVIELGGRGMLRSFWPLVGYLRQHGPRVLFSALPGPNLVALAAKILSPTRVIITQHMHISGDMAIARKLRTKIRALCMRFFYRFADGFMCVSEGLADDFARHTGVRRNRITVIHNPVYDPDILQRAKEDPHHPWFEERAAPVLLSVGRLAPPKDYETILNAIMDLPVRLIVLGEGPLRSHLEGMIKKLGLQDRVDLPGFAENPYAYMARADLLVHSTHFEGFGNVLVEALAVGTPVVATDCPSGPAEILEQGRWGKLVPVGDPVAMRRAIQATLETPEIDKIGLRQRAQYFSIERAAEQYLRLAGE